MQRFPRTAFVLSIFFCFFGFNHNAHGQIQQIRQELARLVSAQDSVSKVNSLNRLGMLYRFRNIDSCFYYSREAKRMATDLHYRQGQTSADHMIAFSLYKKGLYAESLELFSKVLSVYQHLNDTANVARVYMDMAAVLAKVLPDRKEVIAFMQKAIQTGKKAKKDSVLSLVYFNYCNFNTDLSDDSVDYYLSKSREIASRYNDEYMISLNRSKQVYLSNRKNRKPEVLPIAKQLIAKAQRMGNVNLEVYSLFILANHYHEDNPQKALEYYNQICEVARESGDNQLQIYYLTAALGRATKVGDKDEIINAYAALEKAMIADRESMTKFIGDYIRYNNIEQNNKLLSEKNAQRALWLMIISAAALITVLAIYLIMLRRNRNAKEQIEALNDAVDLQIIAMEEAKLQAVKDEQQRLGQDLHDSLASSIASVKHQLEILGMDADDTSLKSKLGRLQAEVTRVYETARNKSHEWFSTAGQQQEQSFERQIRQLTNNALPDSRYQKDIQIDDSALQHVGADIRIALLRIIQEAITNIIKHAKAKSVDILVYEEDELLQLIISDDGRGLGGNKSGKGKANMGLQSIQRRVQLLNGQLTMQSGLAGTEISVIIPLSYVSG